MTHPYPVRIAFLDVGQGDSIVISIPETQEAVVVDCPEADTVFEYLHTQDIQHIRGLLITHLHLDHFRATVEFLENCNSQLGIACERLIFNWPQSNRLPEPDADGHSEPSSGQRNSRQRRIAYQELKSWANMHEDQCWLLLRGQGQTLWTGYLAHVIQTLQPSHGQIGTLLGTGLNNSSAILRIQGSGTSALLMADLEPAGWQELQGRYDNLRNDILKFPHHGAWRDANPDEVLDAVQPSVVIISVGSDGIRYGHPNEHVFQAFAYHPHLRLLCTQVTNRCGHDVLRVKDQVIAEFEKETNVCQVPFIRTSQGCPCAGTIIVELGNQIHVVHPEITFHRNRIIKQYFHNHQCTW